MHLNRFQGGILEKKQIENNIKYHENNFSI